MIWGVVKSVLGGGGLVGEIFGTIKDGLENKRKLKNAIALKKQELITTQQTADISWDQLWAKQAETSWKDEFWTIIIAAPFIMAFIPGLAPYARAGFEVVGGYPETYQWMLAVAVGAAFGVSKLQQIIPGKKK